MALIKELRAKFTAQAEGIKTVARAVRKDLQSIGDITDKSVKRVNNGFGNLNKSLASLDKNLQKVGDTKGFEELNKTLRKVRTELSSTGKISAQSMKELQVSVQNAKDQFGSLSDEGKVNLSRLESSIKRVDAQLGNFDLSISDAKEEIADFKDEVDKSSKGVSGLADKFDDLEDKVEESIKEIGLLKLAILTLAPTTSPVIAGVTTAAMGLVSSFAAAGVGAVAFGAVAVSSLTEVFEASEEVAKLEEKIANAETAEERVKAQKELAAVYADMSKEQREALKELQNFKTFWSNFTKQFEDETFSAFGEGLALLKNLLTGLEPTIDSVAAVVNKLIREMNNAVISGDLTHFFEWLESTGAESLYNFAHISGNSISGLFQLMEAFSPVGQEMEEGLLDLTERFEEWASTLSSSKGFQQFVDYAMGNGPTLLGIFADLVNILVDLGVLIAPAGELLLKVIKSITGFLSYLTDSAVTLRQWEGLTPIFAKISEGIQTAKDSLGTFKEFLKGVFALITGEENRGVKILEKLGLSSSEVQQIINAINLIKVYINGLIRGTVTGFQMMSQFIMEAWGIIWPYIQPLLSKIVSFVGEKVQQITQFWHKNGAQIVQAAQNAFRFILKIIEFFMPACLFLIEMVWSSIKGVINGALKMIMGLIKIFAGIFTGDFSKMWEGIKQLFSGAIEFIWNLLSLLLFGRIITGIKTFITQGIKRFKEFWSKTVEVFNNLDKNVSSIVSKFIGYLKKSWTTAKDNAVSIFTNIKNTVTKIFDDLVKVAKNLPSKIGTGIKKMAGKAEEGLKSLANKLNKNLALGVNGVIGGVNWVLGKVGVDSKIPKWEPPEYKKGTDGHPGGLAILGDGKKKELFITPDGEIGLSPATDTLMNLPEGTKVLSGEDTQKLMSMGLIPAYKDGNISLSDLWSLITSPSKLFNKILDSFGVEIPDFPGILKDFGKGLFNKVKVGFLAFLKEKLPSFDFGGANVSGNIKQWIAQAMAITGVPSSWTYALATIAMKESGGNPRAVNNWDINAKRGIPSMGLMQTIGPTFNAYKMAGLNDILNPVHNAVAAIRYIKSRYGDVFNVPGIKSMARGGPYKGYFEGARVAVKQLAWIAEKGAEYIIPTDGSQRAFDLWYQAGQEIGAFDTESGSNYVPSRVPLEDRNPNRPIELRVNLNGREIAKEIYKDVDEFQGREKERNSLVRGDI